MKVLVTGGTGYIGSHTCVELLNSGHDVVIIDNLSNSKKEVVSYIEKITKKKVKFYHDDCCDRDALVKIFNENKIDMVIHFCGYKAVGESVSKPLMYYRNNLMSTITLCEVMGEFGCKNLVFSSSATVYGLSKRVPYKETLKLSTTNPYGTTKMFIERILTDLYNSDNEWNIVLLRYFNPIGAHESGLIGEDPNDIPNNLMPYIVKVATGELDCLNVFGDDYDTHDGTGVRDYIHVVDLALGHIAAVNKINKENGLFVYNLGTGTGYSVLDVVNTFMKVNNINVKYKIVGRRSGDVATSLADPSKALKELGFKTTKNLEDMCRDAYNFVKKNK